MAAKQSAVMAVACAWFNTSTVTLVQTNVPEEEVGRALGLGTAVMGLASPLGIAIGGVVARQAACLTFQTQRMFPYLTGITLSEYICRCKMSAAAEDLASTDVKVVDLAQCYGYESPTAFNRAFKGVHGLASSHARRKSAPVVTYLRLVFMLSIKGEEAMKYEIREKKAFRVVGYASHEECTMENAGEKATEMWAKVEGEGLIPQIAALIARGPSRRRFSGWSIASTANGCQALGTIGRRRPTSRCMIRRTKVLVSATSRYGCPFGRNQTKEGEACRTQHSS